MSFKQFLLENVDEKYLELANSFQNGDKSVEEELRRFVDEKAKTSGASTKRLYHGGLFNKDIDPIMKVKSGTKRGTKYMLDFGVHFSESLKEAKVYSDLNKKGIITEAFLFGEILDGVNRPSTDEGGSVEEMYVPNEIISRFGENFKKRMKIFLNSSEKLPRSGIPWEGVQTILDKMPPNIALQTLKNAGYSILKYRARVSTWEGTIRTFIAYVFVGNPSEIKSSDIITYDDNKQIIPLSKRFDKTNPDIRY